MIHLAFKLTADPDPRDIVVVLHEPTQNPPDARWPWAIAVEVEGRSYTTYGMDPLDAIENGCQHAARLLRGVYGDALDPPIEPRN
jgi:hypothetical protein